MPIISLVLKTPSLRSLLTLHQGAGRPRKTSFRPPGMRSFCGSVGPCRFAIRPRRFDLIKGKNQQCRNTVARRRMRRAPLTTGHHAEKKMCRGWRVVPHNTQVWGNEVVTVQCTVGLLQCHSVGYAETVLPYFGKRKQVTYHPNLSYKLMFLYFT